MGRLTARVRPRRLSCNGPFLLVSPSVLGLILRVYRAFAPRSLLLSQAGLDFTRCRAAMRVCVCVCVCVCVSRSDITHTSSTVLGRTHCWCQHRQWRTKVHAVDRACACECASFDRTRACECVLPTHCCLFRRSSVYTLSRSCVVACVSSSHRTRLLHPFRTRAVRAPTRAVRAPLASQLKPQRAECRTMAPRLRCRTPPPSRRSSLAASGKQIRSIMIMTTVLLGCRRSLGPEDRLTTDTSKCRCCLP